MPRVTCASGYPRHPQLTSDLLFFLAAMKGGDLSALLGPRGVRQMELQAPALLQRLRQQLSSTSDRAAAADAPPWINYAIPLLVGQSIEPIRLYVQREQAKSQAGGSESGQRFVLELALSALGAMQLDGFIVSMSAAKHLI